MRKTLIQVHQNTSPPTESTAETSLEKKLETDTQAETLGETVKEESVVQTVKETVKETTQETVKETTFENVDSEIRPRTDEGEPEIVDASKLESGPKATIFQLNRTSSLANTMALPTGTKNSVELIKTNEDGSEKLSGAVFSIYSKGTSPTGTPSTTATKTATSNSEGSAIFTDLKANTYYEVRETTAPEGYLPTTQTWDVFIDSAGNGYIDKKGQLTTGSGAQEKITSTLPVSRSVQDNNYINYSSAITNVNTTDNTFTQIIYINRTTNGYYPPYIGYTELDYIVGSNSAITGVSNVEGYRLTEGQYRISEVEAPSGYIGFDGYYTFEVVKNVDDATGEIINSISWIKKHSDAEDTTGTYIYIKMERLKILMI